MIEKLRLPEVAVRCVVCVCSRKLHHCLTPSDHSGISLLSRSGTGTSTLLRVNVLQNWNKFVARCKEKMNQSASAKDNGRVPGATTNNSIVSLRREHVNVGAGLIMHGPRIADWSVGAQALNWSCAQAHINLQQTVIYDGRIREQAIREENRWREQAIRKESRMREQHQFELEKRRKELEKMKMEAQERKDQRQFELEKSKMKMKEDGELRQQELFGKSVSFPNCNGYPSHA